MRLDCQVMDLSDTEVLTGITRIAGMDGKSNTSFFAICTRSINGSFMRWKVTRPWLNLFKGILVIRTPPL